MATVTGDMMQFPIIFQMDVISSILHGLFEPITLEEEKNNNNNKQA